MRFFLFVNLIFITLIIRPVISFAVQVEDTTSSDTIRIWDPVFGDDFQKGLYRTTLDISKYHLTGFIFIKKTSDTSYRILFSNDFGMQIFDFEFLKNEFIVHYCFPSLNRKSLLKLLDNDFRIIIFPNQCINKITQDRSKNKEELSYMINAKTGKWNYRISTASRKILSIRSIGKYFSKTRISLIHALDMVTGIKISNPLIQLRIMMSQISR